MKISLSGKIFLSLFVFSVLLPFQANAIDASGASNEAENEPGSVLVLRLVLRASNWCPEKRMIVATASGSRKVNLNASREGNFTAYVNEQFIVRKNIRVTNKQVSVCFPSQGEPVVSIYGKDSKGFPIEYSNLK